MFLVPQVDSDEEETDMEPEIGAEIDTVVVISVIMGISLLIGLP